MATIRLMEEHDAEALASALGLSLHHIEARWQERLAGRRTMFVADADGRLAGSVAFEEREEMPGLMHLFALAVVPELQSRGIGTQLITAVERETEVRGLSGIHLGVATENVGAQRLYERIGYQRIGEPYDARWTWHGPNGEQRDVVERCYRMFKGVRSEAATSGSPA